MNLRIEFVLSEKWLQSDYIENFKMVSDMKGDIWVTE
jgi:hypothetical protein